MFITELSIKRPAVSWVMSLILIIFGLFVFWKLFHSLIFTKLQNSSFHKGYFLSSTNVIFGIIHGLGFGRYFKMLITDENVSFSLFSFALGVEFAQIIIVFNVLVISLIVINILRQERNSWQLLVGALIISQAISMIFERI